jgi:hypothetical protein
MINFELSKYLNPVFVETGIGRAGDGIQKALDAGFQRIISMDICEDIYNKACKLFKQEIKDGRVELYHGDSSLLLRSILPEINERCTMRLDAHLDGAEQGLSHQKCPLYDELKAISHHHIKNHTIIIDDRRLFSDNEVREDVEGWGQEVSEREIRNRLQEVNQYYHVKYEDGFQENDAIVAGVMCMLCEANMDEGVFCDECYQKDKSKGVFE